MIIVIQSIRHKGLKRLITMDDASCLPAEIAPKLRRMVSFLLTAETPSKLYAVPTWKAHMLIGSRQGSMSLETGG